MFKNKKPFYTLILIPFLIIFILFAWFFTIVFEGEKPLVTIEPLPEFLSGSQKFTLNISDKKRGIKRLKVTVNQEGREITISEETFSFQGLLNRKGVHHLKKEMTLNPATLNLSQGRVDFIASVWDYSKRGGGDGNLSLAQHKMMLDTIPPACRTMTRMHNINRGGTALVVYQTSSDTEKSGIFVDDLFFPGFPANGKSQEGIRVCYFAIPYHSNLNPTIHLWAKDRAGNVSKTTFYYHIRKKRFIKERINITDRFLKRVLPYFSFYLSNSEESDIKKYIKINNELRKSDHRTFFNLREKTARKKLWDGTFLRLKNAATMSRFGDQRSYFYKEMKVDEQVHLGIDLASLAHSPVQASNHGRVIFAERNGIYGLTVALDHGQGLVSIYGHLSSIGVTVDQDVKKGDIIGLTGQTGLAGGDHLHFSIMVNGIFVNPVEWWDDHWIKDNVTRKLDLLKQ